MITRIITGLILLVLSIINTIKGGLLFNYFIGISALIMTYESLCIYKKKPYSLSSLLSYLTVSFIIFSATQPYIKSLLNSKLLFILIVLTIGIHLFELFTKKLFLYSSSFGGYIKTIILVGISSPFLILIRNETNGLLLTLYLCSIIWACDTGAYFYGKKFGRHKLNILSPKKTIEGSIVGLLLGTLSGTLIALFTDLSFLTFFTLAFFISLTAQLSDLYESLLKRTANKKDSSTILPGHGGILDRCDSFILTLPLFYMALRLV